MQYFWSLGAAAASIAIATILPLPASGIESASLFTPDRVKKIVERQFAEAPVMAAIARCESAFRQFGPGGEALRGGAGGRMIGIFQFHEAYHRNAATAAGFDLDTVMGNIGYAKRLYSLEGTAPWASSMHCWSSDTHAAVSATPAEASAPGAQPAASGSKRLSKPLTFGQRHAQVRRLQQALNALGYTVARTGPGAPGRETTTFGASTALALMRFQCAAGIACRKSGSASEYGTLGPLTLRALNREIASQ